MKLKQLSITTFNLYNLNEPGVALYTDRDGWSQAEYELKIAWTARQLKILKSDVFAFQELWHASSLARALDAAALRDEYDTVVPPDADGSKIVCAAIVRKGLLTGAPDWISEFPEKCACESEGCVPAMP